MCCFPPKNNKLEMRVVRSIKHEECYRRDREVEKYEQWARLLLKKRQRFERLVLFPAFAMLLLHKGESANTTALYADILKMVAKFLERVSDPMPSRVEILD
jgi:hypothetical protein